jgi:hypothetical protein
MAAIILGYPTSFTFINVDIESLSHLAGDTPGAAQVRDNDETWPSRHHINNKSAGIRGVA